jgi:hypothetical protein
MATAPNQALTPFKKKLIEIVEAERQFFGGHNEKDGVFADRVGVYWKAVGRSLNGTDTGVAWSGAFISWAMQQAGGATSFPSSGRHGHYIHVAIQNKLQGKLTAPIVGFRPLEMAPRIGDLIGQGRNPTPNISYDEASQKEEYSSHVDVVVGVNEDTISVIGGNVSDTVKLKKVPIDAQGLLAQPKEHWFVVIAVNL